MSATRNAVLVDGVGRTRHRANLPVVERGLPVYRLEITHETASVMESAIRKVGRLQPRTATFKRLTGELPDGTVVYGFEFDDQPYQVWRYAQEFPDKPGARQDVEADFRAHQQAMDLRAPVVTLHDSITPVAGDSGILSRLVVGVARRTP